MILPSAVVAVILAVPMFSAITLPFSSTEIISEFDVAQTTDLSVQSSGSTVAVSVLLEPLSKLKLSELILMSVGGTKTVTVQDAVLPFDVVTPTSVFPAPTAVTLPVLSTVAMAGFFDTHVRVLLPVVLAGDIVASKEPDVSPLFKVMSALSSVTAVMGYDLLPPPPPVDLPPELGELLTGALDVGVLDVAALDAGALEVGFELTGADDVGCDAGLDGVDVVSDDVVIGIGFIPVLVAVPMLTV